MEYFNAQLGSKRKFKNIVGEYPANKRTSKNGERLIQIYKNLNLKIMSTNSKAISNKKKTWISTNSCMGEFQLHHVTVTSSIKTA